MTMSSKQHAQKGKAMTVWFITTVLPDRVTSGGEIASQAFVDAIRAQGHTVTIFGFARDDLEPVPEGSVSFETRPIETAAAGLSAYGWMVRSLLGGRPYVSEKFYSAKIQPYLEALYRQEKPTLIVIDHSQMGWLLPAVAKYECGMIFIAHNAEAELYAAQAKNKSKNGLLKRTLLARDARLIGRTEAYLAAKVDQIWTLTEAERQTFDAMAGGKKARLMELPGRDISIPDEPIEPKVDVGLLGTWAWEVNGRGLTWFIEKVMPHIPANLNVRAGGRGSEEVNGRYPNLSGVGFVEDPVRFMLESSVLAVPTVTGAGVQLKTIEAIAAGVSVVATTIGVRGLENLPAYVTLADTPEAFAKALVQAAEKHSPPDVKQAAKWVGRRRQTFIDKIGHALSILGIVAKKGEAP
jgi:glycosyltransferase involved in cell wall biosynthesis